MDIEQWTARADREAARIVSEVENRFPGDQVSVYGNLQEIVAITWMHGCKTGMNEILYEARKMLDELRAS